MANKSYLDYAGLKRILKTHKARGMRYIFHGTQDEWDALTAAEKDKYEQAEIIDENDLPEMIRNPDWSRAVAVSSAQLTTGYTVPEDGIFVAAGLTMATGGGNGYMYINDIEVSFSTNQSQWASMGNLQCQVAEGDIVRMNVTGLQTSAHFVPYKTTVIDNRFPTNYSTSEQFTGKYWIDGKKIYRKSYSYAGSVAAGSVVTIPEPDASVIAQMIKLEGCCFNSALDWQTIGPTAISPNFYARVYLDSDNSRWGLDCAASACSKWAWTVEYTKTTD